MRKFIVISLLCIFGYSSLIFAQPAEEIYKKANMSYENEDYETSALFYEQLIEMDMVSKEVFYNLGNSYFKLGQIGKAILNYERALRLAPRERDIALNLKVAKGLTVDEIDVPEKGFILSVILFLYEKMNINELTILLSFTYLVIIVLLMFSINFIEKRYVLFYAAGILGLAGSIFLIFLVSKICSENFSEFGIIVSKKVDVRSGPKEDYLLQFTLHEGAKVRVVEKRKNWYEIELSEDLKGWLPQDTVDIL